ncbi:MAG: hypothetical protein ACE5OZ_02350 [Candidatus Heimdallarchaeota archaeon]
MTGSFSRYLRQNQAQAILRYPENVDILLTLLQHGSLRTQEIVDWVKAHYDRSEASVIRRLQLLQDVRLIKRTLHSDRSVEYSVVWTERRNLRVFLGVVGCKSIREEEGRLIEAFAGTYATYCRGV